VNKWEGNEREYGQLIRRVWFEGVGGEGFNSEVFCNLYYTSNPCCACQAVIDETGNTHEFDLHFDNSRARIRNNQDMRIEGRLQSSQQ